MHEVTVDKAKLLEIVKDNREGHREQFEEALEGWQRQVTEALDKAVEDAKAGRKYRTRFDLPQPQDHTDDYDDVIGMLDMHTESTIVLERQDYVQFVNDNWHWMPDFQRTLTTYTGRDKADYARSRGMHS